jgi:hypothetical protein
MFVWISEQTVVILVYGINWFFLTEMEYVYCAVRSLRRANLALNRDNYQVLVCTIMNPRDPITLGVLRDWLRKDSERIRSEGVL